MPSLIIEVINIEGPALLQRQFIQIGKESIHAVFAFHRHTIAI
jgi:hypothetical protein